MKQGVRTHPWAVASASLSLPVAQTLQKGSGREKRSLFGLRQCSSCSFCNCAAHVLCCAVLCVPALQPTDSITAANEANAAKDKALGEASALKLAAEREHAAFEEEWRQLTHLIEDDRSVRTQHFCVFQQRRRQHPANCTHACSWEHMDLLATACRHLVSTVPVQLHNPYMEMKAVCAVGAVIAVLQAAARDRATNHHGRAGAADAGAPQEL